MKPTASTKCDICPPALRSTSQGVSKIVTNLIVGMIIITVSGCPLFNPGGNDNGNSNTNTNTNTNNNDNTNGNDNGNDNDNGNGNDNTTDDVELREVAQGLTSPVGLVPVPDGTDRLVVLDQIGLVRVIDADGELMAEPFLDIQDRLVELMDDFDERGLLGLAFHPDYSDNGRFFVFYTAPPGPDTPDGFDSQTRISEFQVSDDPDLADPASEQILLTIDKPQFNHNGGQLAFGPDGFLYITVGDGGGANDVGFGHNPAIGNGQDRLTLLGKVLRIDINSENPYSIPASNPFADQDDSLGEIWALGLRNPWRASFDQGGTRRLFVGDAGQDLFEEVNIVARGGNYGWRIKEASSCFDPDAPGTPPATCSDTGADGSPLIDPILEYPHFDQNSNAVGIVVIGGYVYRGSAIPSLAGQYIFGDYSTSFETPAGRLFVANENAAGTWTRRNLSVNDDESGALGSFLLGFGQDLAGEVYVLTTQVGGPTGTTGRVHKIVPAD
jgi:glucose/arabinose dehydrogenase